MGPITSFSREETNSFNLLDSRETGQRLEESSTTMPRPSLSGLTKRINSELSPCNKVPTSRKFSLDLPMVPTKLGTGLRASVHINLPKLMKNKDLHQSIADKYHVQIRGIHGEHTETDDGVFDISNLRRLGRNEVQLVQDMYDGVK